MTVDFGHVSDDYAEYRERLPEELFERLLQKGIDVNGWEMIDLGAGTGMFSRGLAKRGAQVVGIETSSQLIEEALKADRLAGIDTIRYVQSAAEHFALPDRYHAAAAVRSWHWFDRLHVLQNLKKHLIPDGYLIVVDSIFLPHSETARITFEVLKENRVELKPAGSKGEVKERRNGMPVHWYEEWQSCSIDLLHEWEHEYKVRFTHEEWCGKVRSISWLTDLSEERRQKISMRLLEKLSRLETNLLVPHKYSAVVLRLRA